MPVSANLFINRHGLCAVCEKTRYSLRVLLVTIANARNGWWMGWPQRVREHRRMGLRGVACQRQPVR
jgi:hypothetical protein